MVSKGGTAEENSSAKNPYTKAFRRHLGSKGISNNTERSRFDAILDHPATHNNRARTDRQQRKMYRASLHASDADRIRREALNIGAARYLAEATPTIGNLIEYTQQSHSTTTRRAGNSVSTVRGMALARANQEACAAVSTEQASLENGGSHGRVSRVKPDDVVRIMYENFSSLGVFGEGPTKHRKIRQINKLIKDYGVDIMAGCETRTDWRFVTMEANKFENLFGNGLPTKGVCASNANDKRSSKINGEERV